MKHFCFLQFNLDKVLNISEANKSSLILLMQLQLFFLHIKSFNSESYLLQGVGVPDLMKMEAGVHRVQRIPSTEKGGRIHTSTVSVAVLPQPSEIELNIPERDIVIETKRASGAGGQHVNTTDSAVRIIHTPTGTAVECQEGRSQIKNKQIAMQKLRTLLLEKQITEQSSKMNLERKSQVCLLLTLKHCCTLN